MSIATEITRLQKAKRDLKAVIADKGVTVPSDVTLDLYAGYVDAIPSGGGGISFYGYVDMNHVDGYALFEALDLNQDGQFTIADYTEYINGMWEGMPYLLQIEPIQADNIPASDKPHHLQDLFVYGFAPWAIPLTDFLDGNYNRLWIVLDVGNIGGEGPKYRYYAVYKGPCAPLTPEIPLAYGDALY